MRKACCSSREPYFCALLSCCFFLEASFKMVVVYSFAFSQDEAALGGKRNRQNAEKAKPKANTKTRKHKKQLNFKKRKNKHKLKGNGGLFSSSLFYPLGSHLADGAVFIGLQEYNRHKTRKL